MAERLSEAAVAVRAALSQGLLNALRAYARLLVGRDSQADDLVHDAVVRMLAGADTFQPGTNLKAWAFTVLRHTFFSQIRRARVRPDHLAEPIETVAAAIPAGQESSVAMAELRRALQHLTPAYRDAILLVGAAGLDYVEAASVCGCTVGTMKSRVARARAQLRGLVDAEPAKTLPATPDAEPR